MKFRLYHPTGTEFCTNCGDQIKEMYLKLDQNRWAKPKLCYSCMKEIIEHIETGKEIDETKKKVIVYDNLSLNKNSWMS